LVAACLLAGFPTLDASSWFPQNAAVQAPLDLVPVTVRVLDRAGKPVTDLKQADFTLVEDGVPQDIRAFTVQSLVPTAQPSVRPAVRQGLPVDPQNHRIFVFALGQGRHEEAPKAITELVRFVRTRLLPQDQVAIFAYDRALDFTTDHNKVADALERFRRAHEDVDFGIGQQLGPTGMAALYGSRAIPRKLQARIDEMLLGAGAKPPTSATPDAVDLSAFANLSLDDFMWANALTLQDQGNLTALVEYLRRVDGEKHLVFVTENGLLWPNDASDRELAAAANDGCVSIHTLQTGGASQPEPGKELEATQRQSQSFKSLRMWSELTGGLSAITASIPVAVDRLDETTRHGYVMTYRSSRAAWDGGYRTIDVKVNRPDVTVLFRHGYYRHGVVGGFDRRSFVTADRLLAAGLFRREVGDIKVKATASVRAGGFLVVEGKITLSRLKLDVIDGAHVGMLNIAVFCLDSGLNSVGTHVQPLPLKLTEDEFTRYSKDGLPYRVQFANIRGTQNIRFIVYDYASDLIGRVDTNPS
jgi:VWFA-related protein